jgi:hypothetical protein
MSLAEAGERPRRPGPLPAPGSAARVSPIAEQHCPHPTPPHQASGEGEAERGGDRGCKGRKGAGSSHIEGGLNMGLILQAL